MKLTLCVLVALAVSAPLFAQTPEGQRVFDTQCSACHLNPASDSRAPNREALRQIPPDAIVNALANGTMRIQGERLSEAERRSVAEFLTGRPPAPAGAASSSATATAVGRCDSPAPPLNPSAGPGWNGWGGTVANARFQPAAAAGLTPPQIPRLKLKWAFGFPDVVAARAQPTIVGGRLFTASEKGDVFALDAKTGCTYWTFRADAGVRSAIAIGPYTTAAGVTRHAAYFGDGRATAYAVDADSGQQIWKRKVEEHPSAAITGSPTLFEGRLFVPTAGVGEEGQGGRAQYECCTFRGSITALDAATGAVVWKTYTIADAPMPRGKNKDGVQVWGPAGGGVWAAPTVDTKRRLLYVATGNGYADPPQKTTDAVLALDLQTGQMKWANQVTPNDVWALGCQAENPDNPNCPAKLGPDHDFSASPALVTTASGRELLVLPQKSGVAYALDPEKQGAVVWQYRIGQGSGLGGQWGGAVDGRNAYFGTSDFLTPTPGGMHAVRLETGERVWYTPPQPKLCGTDQRCNAAQGAALTAIPGAVLSSSADGGLRAYSSDDGSIMWQFDTNREFQTVNGVKASGGTMDGPGPVVVGGMLYVNSGYGGFVGRPGNVLLAFGVE